MARQSVQPARDAALAAMSRWPKDEPLVLLHSGRHHPRWATRSLLARPQLWFRYTAKRRSEISCQVSGDTPPSARCPKHWTHNLWHDLRALLNDSNLPGRWFGYFSYDLGRLIEPTKLAPPSGDWPLVELAWCPDVEELRTDELTVDEQALTIGDPQPEIRNLTRNFTRSAYESAVCRVLEYIAAGDVFQVNLAQRFTTEYRGQPRQLYERLATVSPAWYGAYFELPGQRAIISTSPELFLSVERGHVVTRPIKGTRAAQCDARELLNSAKDTAELNMIVDLMRNDLGRVCSYGSVQVTESRTIETHPTVHHAVATIEGDLHPSKDIVDLLKATLPGGSVTGAPKVRAMQIIDELEPCPRGPYCGAIGCISRTELQLSVAIRTMLKRRELVDFSVGGGIVADSNPSAEYDETLTKAQAMLAALGDGD